MAGHLEDLTEDHRVALGQTMLGWTGHSLVRPLVVGVPVGVPVGVSEEDQWVGHS